jgi:putative flavoprotein involved in K+ transport
VVGGVVEMQGKRASFAGGESVEIDAVIWATGYRDDADWVAIPAIKDARGAFVHQRGVSPVPGLSFMGRSWQWTRGSALLHGVGADAAFLVGQIATQLDESSTPRYHVFQRASG